MTSASRTATRCNIETRIGRVEQRLVFDPDLDPRVEVADFGWWFPEDPSGSLGWDRANINMLTSVEGPIDPAVGVMVLRGIPCRVYKTDDRASLNAAASVCLKNLMTHRSRTEKRPQERRVSNE